MRAGARVAWIKDIAFGGIKQMPDPYLGMYNVIVDALKEAEGMGLDYTGQTGHAVRAVTQVGLGTPEALFLVKRLRAEQN